MSRNQHLGAIGGSHIQWKYFTCEIPEFNITEIQGKKRKNKI